jgi:hypothetical protein
MVALITDAGITIFLIPFYGCVIKPKVNHPSHYWSSNQKLIKFFYYDYANAAASE